MNHTMGRIGLVLLLCTVCTGVPAQTCRSDIPATAPDSHFVDNGDGTVTDVATGLMWKQCLEGVSGTGCTSGSVTSMTWQQALQRGVDAAFAGHTDWRLPNMNELESLVERRCDDPAINARFFPNTPGNSWVWSSSPDAYRPSHAWSVFFYNGFVLSYNKESGDPGDPHIRLVRAGQ